MLNITEALLLLWLFSCIFIVSAQSLYVKLEKNKVCDRKKLNCFTLVVINIPSFVFSFFMLVAMLVGVLFYV
ncbi:hypothetical protein [Staphylococcus phage PT1-4]